MPYAAVVTVQDLEDGDKVIVIEETAGAAASEATVDLDALGIDPKFRLLGGSTVKRSGAAATCEPVLEKGLNTAGTGVRRTLLDTEEAALEVWNVAVAPIPVYAEHGKLYHRSTPASGTDNAFRTEYQIREGWLG